MERFNPLENVDDIFLQSFVHDPYPTISNKETFPLYSMHL